MEIIIRPQSQCLMPHAYYKVSLIFFLNQKGLGCLGLDDFLCSMWTCLQLNVRLLLNLNVKKKERILTNQTTSANVSFLSNVIKVVLLSVLNNTNGEKGTSLMLMLQFLHGIPFQIIYVFMKINSIHCIPFLYFCMQYYNINAFPCICL